MNVQNVPFLKMKFRPGSLKNLLQAQCLLLCFVLGQIISPSANALETDQYVMWGRSLQDSSAAVNKFLNEALLKSLEKTKALPQSTSCSEVAMQFLKSQYQSTGFLQPIETFAFESPDIDRFPHTELNDTEAFLLTIYRNSWFFKLSKKLGRNVKINEVYLGIDKLGHFLQLGMDYYKEYLQALQKGKKPEEALQIAINSGIFTEKTYYGYLVSGVFSYADLEANFQGLKLALNLCEGPQAHLKFSDDQWTLQRKIDIAEYVNPFWDESFNTNHYAWNIWPVVSPELKKYCGQENSPAVLERLNRYRRYGEPSYNQVYLKSLIWKDELANPFSQSLEVICRYKTDDDKNKDGGAIPNVQTQAKKFPE